MLVSFVDLVFLTSLMRQPNNELTGSSANCTNIMISAIASTFAIAQIVVYNIFGQTEKGEMVGEKAAHYFEFSFEIMSALITFWFCVDNKFVADKEISEIMYGDHRDCAVCHSKSIEMKTSVGRSAKNGRKEACGKYNCDHVSCGAPLASLA